MEAKLRLAMSRERQKKYVQEPEEEEKKKVSLITKSYDELVQIINTLRAFHEFILLLRT